MHATSRGDVSVERGVVVRDWLPVLRELRREARELPPPLGIGGSVSGRSMPAMPTRPPRGAAAPPGACPSAALAPWPLAPLRGSLKMSLRLGGTLTGDGSGTLPCTLLLPLASSLLGSLAPAASSPAAGGAAPCAAAEARPSCEALHMAQ
mmetsp:Transcript_40300/g.126469  ORF Transcript_40300/g.126469 Transcript_40300/m.126469 type:complete len:150 (+) Transcript_40300:665-1114(+)